MKNNQLFRFIVVGIANTGFYYIVYSGFVFFGIDYKLSVLFATIIGVLFSFKTFGKYVFNNSDKKLIFRFISVYIVLYFLNISFITLFDIVIKNYYISGFIATIFCAIISFLLNKYFVFKED